MRDFDLTFTNRGFLNISVPPVSPKAEFLIKMDRQDLAKIYDVLQGGDHGLQARMARYNDVCIKWYQLIGMIEHSQELKELHDNKLMDLSAFKFR